MKNGINRTIMVIIEWVGPRLVRKTKSKSTSGSTEVASRSGRFSFTLTNFDVPFPNNILNQNGQLQTSRKPLNLKPNIKRSYYTYTPTIPSDSSMINHINNYNQTNPKTTQQPKKTNTHKNPQQQPNTNHKKLLHYNSRSHMER